MEGVFTLLKTVAASSTEPKPTLTRTSRPVIDRAHSPALIVRPESDQILERLNDRVLRELTLSLTYLGRATTIDDGWASAESFMAQAHLQLMTIQSQDTPLKLLLLSVRELESEWDDDATDMATLTMSTRYAFQYKTFAHDTTLLG